VKFGYARVSKSDQSLDIQIQKLNSAGCEEIFKEKISGARDDRPQLEALLSKLRKGDIVYVVRLDRLGRRMIKLIELIVKLLCLNLPYSESYFFHQFLLHWLRFH
jgi:DNA invertase Pin-like site-specific DNA recombinase